MSSLGAIEWMTAASRRVGTRSNLSALIPVFLFIMLAGGCTTLPVDVDYDITVKGKTTEQTVIRVQTSC